MSKCIIALAACLFIFLHLTGCDGSNSVDPQSFESPDDANSPPDSSQNLFDCTISDTQQQILDLTNDARETGVYCGEEWYPAVEPLTWDCLLIEAAYIHTLDMVENNFFNHIGSDGLRVSNRVTNVGYSWNYVGENIAAGYLSPESVVDGWLNSPGHCRNIMNENFEEFGAAVIDRHWTQVFARPW